MPIKINYKTVMHISYYEVIRTHETTCSRSMFESKRRTCAYYAVNTVQKYMIAALRDARERRGWLDGNLEM